MTAEDKLKNLVFQIESTSLSDNDKTFIYVLIRKGINKIIFPILTKHMDSQKLLQLEKNLETVTPDKYIELLNSALEKPDLALDLEKYVLEFLDMMEKKLKEDQVIT